MFFYESLQAYIEGEKQKLARLPTANIPETAVILKVFMPGENQDKQTNLTNYSVTHQVDHIQIDNLGIIGDRHHRATRLSTGREKQVHKSGTLIREHRHIFAVSEYDCKILSQKLGVQVTPELLGANILIGREDGKDFSLSELPHNTYVVIAPSDAIIAPRPAIAVLVNYTKQQGCGITGNAIAKTYNNQELNLKFVENAKDNRGIVCSVEAPVETPAQIKAGQKIFFKFPMGVTP